jgi:mannose-6-phosphate isomerase-like protein (cupin superfamily)
MPIVRAPDAVPHRLHGATFHSYAAPATGSTELCAWRLEVGPGTTGTAHVVSREEVLLLLDGVLTVTLDDVTTEVSAGEVVVVPAGSRFRVDNTSGRGAAAWVTTSVGLAATLADGTTISPPWVR